MDLALTTRSQEALSDAVWLGFVDETELAEAEGADNPFAGLDYRIFRPSRGMVEPLPVGIPESHAALRPEPDPSRSGGS